MTRKVWPAAQPRLRASLVLFAIVISACSAKQAPAPPASPPPAPAPWSKAPLLRADVPAVYVQQWSRAQNRNGCALIAFAELGEGSAATPRAATFSGGWAVAYDLPQRRSAFGVAGTGSSAADSAYSAWPNWRTWSDGSSAGYGPEGGTGPNQLAYLRIAGQSCLYNVWSNLGREHLELLLDALRRVDHQPTLPARAANALTGSSFIASVAVLPREEREAAILRELLSGNIPQFLRVLRPVEVSATDVAGVKRTIVFEVMPDYLAIGSDDDFVRMPMNPYTAQAFCDAFGFVLPTRKMVNDIWAAAPVQLDPRPLTQERESPLTFLQHHRIIEEQLAGTQRGAFVAGIKKDVVISNRLLERPERVAIYGWHYPNGQPIQPLYPGHVDWYVDYSHGIRPVRRWLRVDGVVRDYEDLLSDPRLLGLLSDEGQISVRRYQK